MKELEAIAANKWVLGIGKDGIYSNLTISIKKSKELGLTRGQVIEMDDEEILNKIEQRFLKSWINSYAKKEVYLKIKILNVGIDCSGRKYAVENSVDGVMHSALSKIGIKPPPIYALL